MKKLLNIESNNRKNNNSENNKVIKSWNRNQKFKDISYPLALIIFLVLSLEIIIKTKIISESIIPAPSQVIVTFFQILPELKEHIIATLDISLKGFLIAIILAFILAFIMDSFKSVDSALYPLIIYSQTIPLLAIAPLYVLLFGYGTVPKILVVVSSCFFPIIISLLESLKKVDKDLLNLVSNMGAKKNQLFFIVKLPSIITGFFSGLKIAATYCISGAIIGEWLGGSRGVGIYIIRAKRSYSYDKMFATILLIVILSMGFVYSIHIIQKIVEKKRGIKNEN